MTAPASPSLGIQDHIIDARERPLQEQRRVLVVRNAQGNSRWEAPPCGLDVPDHCDHVVAD